MPILKNTTLKFNLDKLINCFKYEIIFNDNGIFRTLSAGILRNENNPKRALEKIKNEENVRNDQNIILIPCVEYYNSEYD